MYHMKTATVRDLRYHFDQVEDLLQQGEEIEITKRRRVVARLLPPAITGPAPRPDFSGRLKEIYGGKIMKVSGAQLLAEERSRD
jgi:antitoxin (DNA-binding transcriptional repressor) of toxin-antitoxin stability system